MIKNLVKSSLQTVDEFTMSVKETVANIEKVSAQEESEQIPSSEAPEVPQEEAIPQKEEAEEGGQDDVIFKKCTSKRGYDEYISKTSHLRGPSKNFRLLCEDAKLRLDPNSTLPKQGCLDLIKEIDKAYEELAIIRREVTSTFTPTAQEEDTYLDKFFRMRQDARALYYEKFDKQFSAASSVKSAKASMRHSTPIEVRDEPGSEEEFEVEEHKQKLEEERKKANAIRLEADKAKRSLLSRRDEKARQYQERAKVHRNEWKALNEDFEKEMNSFDEAHQRLVNGEAGRPVSPCPSVSPSVTSSCVAPANESFQIEDKIEVIKNKNEIVRYNCRHCPQKFETVEQVDNHEHVVHGRKLPAPNLQVQAPQESSDLKKVINHLAIREFNPKQWVKKSFFGNDPKTNYQSYAKWRNKWKNAEAEAFELGITKARLYHHMMDVLEGTAHTLVDCSRVTDKTYDWALKKLDERYNNPTFYLKEVTNQLKDLPRMKDSQDSLLKGINALESGWESLQERNFSDEDLLTMYFLNAHEPKLSPKALEYWSEKRKEAKDDTHPLGYRLSITDFFQCLRDAETFLMYSDSSKSGGNEGGKKNEEKDRKPAIFGAHATGVDEETPLSAGLKKCPVPNCKQSAHTYMLKCPQLPKMRNEDVLAWCKKEGITCKLCLNSKVHESKKCPALKTGSLQRCQKEIEKGHRKGQVCNGFHCIFVHFDMNPGQKSKKEEEKSGNSSHQTSAAGGNSDPPQQKEA